MRAPRSSVGAFGRVKLAMANTGLTGAAPRPLQAAANARHQVPLRARDLAPENLVLNTRGYLKIADLGLAKKLAGLWRAWPTSGALRHSIIIPRRMSSSRVLSSLFRFYSAVKFYRASDSVGSGGPSRVIGGVSGGVSQISPART